MNAPLKLKAGAKPFKFALMSRARFPISSDQLELLLAFEQSRGLADLADVMGRDPSVVSRNLQRLAETQPVISKINGRWEMTGLGVRLAQSAREWLAEQKTLLSSPPLPVRNELASPRAMLVIINAQNALLEPRLGERSNTDAEINIATLLQAWREKNRPVLHVRHVSESPQSPFFRHAPGSRFLTALAPAGTEFVVEKSKSGAFSETKLAAMLSEAGIDTLILTGFTANECIDATARQAADLGFTPYVVGDATVTFDLAGPDGKLIKAEKLHRLVLANLHALCAKVISTEDLMRLKLPIQSS